MFQNIVRALTLVGVAGLLSMAACGEAPPGASAGESPAGETPSGAVPSDPIVEASAGSIALALKVGNQQLDSMSYAIVGSGFTKSGSIDVSHSSKPSTIVGGIPFGSNYSLTITGKGTSQPPLDCSGSTSFDLNDVGPLSVTVPITCKEPAVVQPPTPAPVPPFAVAALACMLAAAGIAAQRRAARS